MNEPISLDAYRLQRSSDRSVYAAFEAAIAGPPIPYTDEGAPMLQDAIAQTVEALTPEQVEALAARARAMTPGDWDDFAATMIRVPQLTDLLV